IPYVTLELDDEDSLSERLENTKGKGRVDIAAIHLPRISNFTDLNVLSCYEDISVRYVRSLSQFGEPDLIVLPGTKNTLEDLKW
ncbi:cobyric acid synthase CobQ, partial [Bittarella massiliensis]|nr:cobyric acid synthase CobQ [Bittarella massiliensis (ex Durand et al. 2017)]